MSTWIKSAVVAASFSAMLSSAHAQCVGKWLSIYPSGLVSAPGAPCAVFNDMLAIQQNQYAIRWLGDRWLSSTTTVYTPKLMAAIDSDLYLGATNQTNGRLVSRWDGTNFVGVTPNPSSRAGSEIRAMASYQNKLVVAGILRDASDRNLIFTRNANAWQSLGVDAFGGTSPISALAVYEGELYAAGLDLHLASGAPDGNILRYDGTTWKKVGATGLKIEGSPYAAMAVYQGKLVIGSKLIRTADGTSLGSLVTWDGSTIAAVPVATPRVDAIACMTEYHGDLVIGGTFDATWGVDASGVVRWNGTTFAAFDRGLPGLITNLAAYHDDLYISSTGGPASMVRWSDAPVAWTVQSPPSRPFNKSVTATLSATCATGYSGVSYQWKRNGVNLFNGPGGASSGGGTVSYPAGLAPSTTNGAPMVLTIAGIQPSDAGVYTIAFTTACGSSESVPATITVRGCPSDLNDDGVVNDADFALFATDYNRLVCTASAMPAWCPSDLNGDGFVDDTDFVRFAAAYEDIVCE